MMSDAKVCSKCLISKDRSEFSVRKASYDGLAPGCKKCMSDYDKMRGQTENRKQWCRDREKTPASKERRKNWLKTEAGKKYALRQTRTCRAKYPEKNLARKRLLNAILSRKITRPETCSYCKIDCIPHGHHHDYSKPLDVVWLCRKCHNELHAKIKESTHV